MSYYLSGLMLCLQPMNLLLITGVAIVGIIFGAIPGLSATLGISLLLPVTFGLSSNTSFIILLAMWISGVSGTFISAVLIGIPGSSSSIATCFDGYPMTMKGEASKALAVGMTASFLGTVASVLIATVVAPVIADLALLLGPWEYFSLCFCAITLVAALSKGNIWKGLLSAGIGLFLGCVGLDPITGIRRFTFGIPNLNSGLSTVCQMLGMFALARIIVDYGKGEGKLPKVKKSELRGFGITIKDYIRSFPTIIRSFLIGLWVGFLPGMGSGISNMVAYGQAKASSKHPELFGTGYEEGIWASETANNASLGGAMIPMMALGIPGDGITAMLIAGLTIHGLQAGPLFLSQQPDLCYLMFACVLISAIITFVLEVVFKRWLPLILKVPYHFLYSVILTISFIGAFGVSNSEFNFIIMLGWCVLAVFLMMEGVSLSPLVLAFILSDDLETYFRRGVSYAHGSYLSFITRPVSLIFLLLAVFSVAWPYIGDYRKKKKETAIATAAAQQSDTEVHDD